MTTLGVSRAKAHDVYFDTGADSDDLRMRGVSAVSDLHANLGDGDDVFRISYSSALNPHFDGGAGLDTIYNLPNAFDEVLASINFETVI